MCVCWLSPVEIPSFFLSQMKSEESETPKSYCHVRNWLGGSFIRKREAGGLECKGGIASKVIIKGWKWQVSVWEHKGPRPCLWGSQEEEERPTEPSGVGGGGKKPKECRSRSRGRACFRKDALDWFPRQRPSRPVCLVSKHLGFIFSCSCTPGITPRRDGYLR